MATCFLCFLRAGVVCVVGACDTVCIRFSAGTSTGTMVLKNCGIRVLCCCGDVVLWYCDTGTGAGVSTGVDASV